MKVLGFMAVGLLVSCGGSHTVGGAGGAGGFSGAGGTMGAGGSGGATPDAGPSSGGMGGSSPDGGISPPDSIGSAPDANGFDGTDGGFAWDFAARARAALATGAPSWTCATALPTVPAADAAAAREAVRQYVARVVGVGPTDFRLDVPTCGASMPTTCATRFAHDCAKSGGAIYDTVAPLSQELEANATVVEETIWTPMQNGISMAADVVMSGISDGVLVGMVVFNGQYPCR